MKNFLRSRSLYWLSMMVFACSFLVVVSGVLVPIYNAYTTFAYATFKTIFPIGLFILAMSVLSLISELRYGKAKRAEEQAKAVGKSFIPPLTLRVIIYTVIGLGIMAVLPSLLFSFAMS